MRGGDSRKGIFKGKIMSRAKYSALALNLLLISILITSLQSCKKAGNAKSGFYYWKSNFKLDASQSQILKQVADDKIYIRFFDINWDSNTNRAFPNAIINFTQSVSKLNITPVVFTANKTFEQIKDTAIDSLAIRTNALINHIAQKQGIIFKAVQFDCDWTLSTRDKYFHFLSTFKKLSGYSIEATIRLHQVKYKLTTGVPPVEKGILMFYNMGQVNANLRQPSSIYNEGDAGKYVIYISKYPLPLDVALPLFSWAVDIREGRVVQIYESLNENSFNDTQNFEYFNNAYRAKKSFFLNGIYIKENDIFKLEHTDVKVLKRAAKQLSFYLPPQKNRTIIYYELGNLDLSEFKAETLRGVSADL